MCANTANKGAHHNHFILPSTSLPVGMFHGPSYGRTRIARNDSGVTGEVARAVTATRPGRFQSTVTPFVNDRIRRHATSDAIVEQVET